MRGPVQHPQAQGQRIPRLGALPRSRAHSRAPCRPKVVASATASQQALSSPAITSVASKLTAAAPGKERLKALLEAAAPLPRVPESERTRENQVMGCTSRAWVSSSYDKATGRVTFTGDADSEVSRALAALLCSACSGLPAAQVAALEPSEVVRALGLDASAALPVPSRSSGAMNVMETIRKRARLYVDEAPIRFPSLLITADSLVPQGAFAEAQHRFLQPQPERVSALAAVLSEKAIGVVAHFYMDPEVQGVLTSASAAWPHIAISDSLVMADKAVRMCEQGCKAVVVLGVDFMSENVRAIMDEAGFQHIPVYRMASEAIGCSLAEAAESPAYDRYLEEASTTPRSVHVVYINTSLRTKAFADHKVPTITCTSSNVVQTVLTAFAQVEGCNVWYGPDTYMGRNLATLFTSMATWTDEEIRAVHPQHSQATIKALLPRLRYFEDGTCIVHHLFGGEVCKLVRELYGDAYLTAHFEVPGEMFELAMQARRERGMGVVGSTQNILDFIAARTEEAVKRDFPDRLQFVLGTESGMITSIVRKVQQVLASAPKNPGVEVEIVFPVAPSAITTKDTASTQLPGGLAVVPGPAGGEGCSMEGGCASCPYMKMNTLDALMGVCNKVQTPGESLLAAFEPKKYQETVGGKSLAKAGCRPILHMRGFQKGGRFTEELQRDIETRKN